MTKETLKLQELTIPVQVLIEEGLRPDMYVFMFYLYNNQMDNAYVVSGLHREEVLSLCEDGYLELLETHRSTEYQGKVIQLDEPEVLLKAKGRALFEATELDKKFDEFWEAYPSTVPNGEGGIRVLHAVGKETNDYRICKKKYQKIIKKPGAHEMILKALKTQILIITLMAESGRSIQG